MAQPLVAQANAIFGIPAPGTNRHTGRQGRGPRPALERQRGALARRRNPFSLGRQAAPRAFSSIVPTIGSKRVEAPPVLSPTLSEGQMVGISARERGA